MAELVEIMVNGRWPLKLLAHRAARPEWPTWEAERLALTHSLVSVGTMVWEVGAEEGDYPALYATWGARVVMVEPNPYVWAQIKIHWEANTGSDPAALVVGLASDVTQHVETDYPQGFRTDGWPEVAYGEIRPEHGFRHIWEHAGVSPQFRLDALGLPVPELICMDIEGGELHALRGMEKTLREHRPDLIVSIHPEFLRDLYGYSTVDVDEFMRSVGYEGELVCIDHEEHWIYRPR